MAAPRPCIQVRRARARLSPAHAPGKTCLFPRPRGKQASPERPTRGGAPSFRERSPPSFRVQPLVIPSAARNLKTAIGRTSVRSLDRAVLCAMGPGFFVAPLLRMTEEGRARQGRCRGWFVTRLSSVQNTGGFQTRPYVEMAGGPFRCHSDAPFPVIPSAAFPVIPSAAPCHSERSEESKDRHRENERPILRQRGLCAMGPGFFVAVAPQNDRTGAPRPLTSRTIVRIMPFISPPRLLSSAEEVRSSRPSYEMQHFATKCNTNIYSPAVLSSPVRGGKTEPVLSVAPPELAEGPKGLGTSPSYKMSHFVPK